MELVEVNYRVTATFFPSRVVGLVLQIRCAAISVPSSNLAEGAARDGSCESSIFLSIARWSLSELDTQYQIAVRLDYTKPDPDTP